MEPKHLADVLQILPVATVDLGERLPDELEVIHGELAFLGLEAAAVLPPARNGEEVVGCRQLDVELELLLETGDRAQEAIRFLPDQLQVDVDGRVPPAQEHGRGASGQIHPDRLTRLTPESGQEGTDALGGR
jgi:hypothetical protein